MVCALGAIPDGFPYLGPCWVRAATVEHGHERSPPVTKGLEESHVADLQLMQLGIIRRTIQIVVTKVVERKPGARPLRIAGSAQPTYFCRILSRPRKSLLAELANLLHTAP